MAVLSTMSQRSPPRRSMSSPSKSSPPRAGLKRAFSGHTSVHSPVTPAKHRRLGHGPTPTTTTRLQHPKQPVGEAWPISALRAFDAPTELVAEINYGPMLRKLLRSRGWRYSTKPCHGTYDWDADKNTFHVKEFEACLRGKTPAEVFGKKGVVEDGYVLQPISLPKHALWFMGRMPYRVPGTANEAARMREDFVRIVVEHGDKLPGKLGNYRMAKFLGTETLLFKTHLTEAFQDKPWYPETYILPKDKSVFLKEIRSRGESHDNIWIGKPRNDYGGAGIRVWKGN